MAVTIQKIAELSGVSRGTVDRVLHGRPNVNPMIREKVVRAAEKLGYQPPVPPKSADCRQAAILIPQWTDGYFNRQIVSGIRKALRYIADPAFVLTEQPLRTMTMQELLRAMDEQIRSGVDGLIIRAENTPEVRAAIEGQGKLTEVLAAALDAAATLAEVEDLYRPYKQKRRTRASMARERGLEPLAALAAASGPAVDLERAARDYVDPEKGVETVEAALQGASDILAEEISDRADLRKELRQLYLRRGVLISKAAEKEPEDSVYRLYYDFKCPVSRVQGYQTLAINRGEREKLLKLSLIHI